jgi:hypothetical protein
MMAPIPEVLLEVNLPLRGLKPLKILWSTMPENLRTARETSVVKFKDFLGPKRWSNSTDWESNFIVEG